MKAIPGFHPSGHAGMFKNVLDVFNLAAAEEKQAKDCRSRRLALMKSARGFPKILRMSV